MMRSEKHQDMTKLSHFR